MSPDQSTPLRPALIAAIVMGLLVALGASGFDQYFKIPQLEAGDVAVNALQVDNAKHFQELYGNYSRFEFNHPGPAFFYVYAAGEWLLYDLLKVVPSPGNAQLLASMFLQSVFFALALTVMLSHLQSRSWLPLTLLAAALYFGPLRDPFMSIWPPHVLLMPFLCFLAVCCSAAAGRFSHLPLVVLVGGFLFHGHVAQPVFVASLGGLAFALAIWRQRQAHPGTGWRELAARQRKIWVLCGVLAAVFLLPLLLDVLIYGTRSNIATIFGRFYANTKDSKTLLQSFLYFVSFGTPAQNQEEIFTVMGPQVGEFFSLYAGRVVFWSIIFLLTPLLAFVRPERLTAGERCFLLTGHLMLGVSVLGCLLWGKAQAGAMAQFNGYFYYAIYFFAFLLALSWIDRLIRPAGNTPLAAALCAVSAVAFTWSFRLPRLSIDETGIPAQRVVEAALRQDSGRPKLLVFEHRDWPAVASVALDLQRKGVKFYTAPWWQFMFGLQHQLTRLGPAPEDEADIWWLTNPGDGGQPISPTLSLFKRPAPIIPTGDEINFHGGANGFRYVVLGLSAGNIDYANTEMPRVVLIFEPRPATQNVRITIDAQSARGASKNIEPQPAIVLFNGHEIGRVTAAARALLTVMVPRELWNSQPRGKLELQFPNAVRSIATQRPRFERWSAWGLWSLRFDPAP